MKRGTRNKAEPEPIGIKHGQQLNVRKAIAAYCREHGLMRNTRPWAGRNKPFRA